SPSGKLRMADGISSAALTTSFIHLHDLMSLVTSTRPEEWRSLGTSFNSILLIGIHRPEGEPGLFLVVLPIGDTWDEHIGCDLDDGANRPLGANHGCDVQMRHAIL